MRCSAFCVLLLVISEPLLVHAKVVVLVSRHVRRSPAVPWRPPSTHYKKSSYSGNDFHRHAYYNYGNRYYNRKPYRPLPYPQGGDDFDQSHNTANHVHIPHGKDISHGISFGKGYIPYENIKSSGLPFVHERYAGAYERQPIVPNYPSTGITSVGQEYAASANAHTYDSSHIDSFFSDMEGAARSELQNTLKDTRNKYYASRSIEKDLSLRNQQALNNAVEKNRDSLAKDNELPKDASPAAYGHIPAVVTAATATNAAAVTGMQGAVVLPAGIPPATIAGNKDGIVLRDTVSLDEYHRKLEELTKTWPSVLSNGVRPNSYSSVHQSLHAVDSFPSTGLSVDGTGYGSTGTGWMSNFAQSKQGYDVREDHAESTSHDFRTMPIHNTPYHLLPPLSMNVGISAGVVPHQG
ncbi:uncharacterized protein LOC105186431 [Harpegnathos saltator]|uniref:uncharacterized protein LOC105186431 n=1 Tax=Harpegnathos saltator TaxID=610380 RepID=UPI00058D0034|nr:uncharacterized protein LOC105186431 [Harpegnathos saltator]